ncbi:MAG: hypothetical protein JXR88_10165 [Clostridia bacterium]|nr:hypothetical protein [Clostridia bacterium]
MIEKEILEAFHIQDDGQHLEGGQNQSIRFGHVVLKPVEDEVYYNTISEIFNSLDSNRYRISKHMLSKYGQYAYKGYGATWFEPGFEVDDRLEEKLLVSHALHESSKNTSTNQLPKGKDPWSKAHTLLWNKERLKAVNEQNIFVNQLLDQLPDYNETHQLIHSDLGGNILFHQDLPPLVIDFSPAEAPKSFADAVLVCDSIAWGNQSIESLKLLRSNINYRESILYAVAFRVATIACFEKHDMARLEIEWQAYKNIWDYVLN